MPCALPRRSGRRRVTDGPAMGDAGAWEGPPPRGQCPHTSWTGGPGPWAGAGDSRLQAPPHPEPPHPPVSWAQSIHCAFPDVPSPPEGQTSNPHVRRASNPHGRSRNCAKGRPRGPVQTLGPGNSTPPRLPVPPAAAAPQLPTSCPVASGTQLRSSTAGQTCDDQGVATPSLSTELPRGSQALRSLGGGGCSSFFSQGG